MIDEDELIASIEADKEEGALLNAELADSKVEDILGFLMGGGTYGHEVWGELGQEDRAAIKEAGRRLIAYKACIARMAITDFKGVWSIFDGGAIVAKAKADDMELEEKELVEASAQKIHDILKGGLEAGMA